MPLKWITFCATIWIGGMIIGALLSGEPMFGESLRGTASNATIPSSIWNPASWFTWLNNLVDIFLLNFSIFEGDYQVIRYILLGPIIITMGYGLLVSVVSFFSGLFRPV